MIAEGCFVSKNKGTSVKALSVSNNKKSKKMVFREASTALSKTFDDVISTCHFVPEKERKKSGITFKNNWYRRPAMWQYQPTEQLSIENLES